MEITVLKSVGLTVHVRKITFMKVKTYNHIALITYINYLFPTFDGIFALTLFKLETKI